MSKKRSSQDFYLIENTKRAKKCNSYSADGADCQRCKAKNITGERCRRLVCNGLPVCFQHLNSCSKLCASYILNPVNRGIFNAFSAKHVEGSDLSKPVFNTGEGITTILLDYFDKSTRPATHAGSSHYVQDYDGAYYNEPKQLRNTYGSIFNHDDTKTPNARMQIDRTMFTPVVKLIATRPIYNDEMILV